MNMKDVIKALNSGDPDKLYNRIEKQQENLRRMKSLAQILVMVQGLNNKVRKHDGSLFSFKIAQSGTYPFNIDLLYKIDGGEEQNQTICSIDDDYCVLDFVDSIKDNNLSPLRKGELTIDAVFNARILPMIIGAKLAQEYWETKEKVEVFYNL